MSGTATDPIKVPLATQPTPRPLVWRRAVDTDAISTTPFCGTSRFRAHHEELSDVWHVKGFRKSCGRASCPKCHDRVALKEAVKAEKRLRRAAIALHHEGGQDPRRWHFILDPGSGVISLGAAEHWWSTRLDYADVRSRANSVLKEAGLKSWVLIFHAEDDYPEIGCPWRGHFHGIGDGEFERRAVTDRGWNVRLDDPRDTSPVEWLTAHLSRLSSYAYRRSIQRLTYGGLAAPNAQAKGAAGGASEDSKDLRCELCAKVIPKGEWFRATPTRDLGPSGEGCWLVDPREWRFEHPVVTGYGPPIWATVSA